MTLDTTLNDTQQSNIPHFDVLILGGGAAGVSAGLCLLKRNNISVGIIEAGNYLEERAVELLPLLLPLNAKPLLNFLDVWDSFSQTHSLQEYGCEAAWGSSQLKELNHNNPTKDKGWHINKHQFDASLGHTFSQRGGTLLTNTKVITCKKHAHKTWLVNTKDEQGLCKQYTCKYIIDASGRRGLMRTNLNLSLSVHDRLVAVGRIGVLPVGKVMSRDTHIEACEYGWWHISPMDNHQVSIVLMSDPDIVSNMQLSQSANWTKLMHRTTLTGSLMKDVIFRDDPRTTSCFSSYLKKMGDENWIAVGDAAASYDPLCSSGILRAIDSGVHGALVAIDTLFSDGKNQLLEAYTQSIQKEFHHYLQTQWQCYHREKRWSKSLFWMRRRSVIGISPDSMIKETYFYEHKLDPMSVHLQGHELQALWSLCKPAKKLKYVVKDFSRFYSHIAEQKIMLALQELIQKESIKLTVPDLDYNSEMHLYSMME